MLLNILQCAEQQKILQSGSGNGEIRLFHRKSLVDVVNHSVHM